MNNYKYKSNNWATDFDKNAISNGEIWDVDVIDQSIEMILGTGKGERIFNPSFGMGLQNRIFNMMNESEANSILDEIVRELAKWEDRITVRESDMRIIANPNENSVIIVIPYVIKNRNIVNTFKRKIYSNG